MKNVYDAINQNVVRFIKNIIETRKVRSQADLARIIGQTPQYVNNVLKEFRKPSQEFITKLVSAFPEANDFIFGGIGPTPNPKVYNEARPTTKSTPPLKSIYAEPNGKSIPIYDTEIFGSIEPSLSDTPTMRPAAFISIPLFNQGDAAVQVTGHSMKGYINHGDWIVIKRITNRESIIYGEPHLVITRADNIKTVKFIKQPENPKKLTLIPYNIEQFDPQDINWNDVYEVWRVIGLFRTV